MSIKTGKQDQGLRALLLGLLSAATVQASSSQSDAIAYFYSSYTLHDTKGFELSSQPEDSAFDSGWMLGGSQGLAMNAGWAVQLRWDYTTNGVSEGNLSPAMATTTSIDDSDFASQWVHRLRQGLGSQTAHQIELRGVHSTSVVLEEKQGTDRLAAIGHNPLVGNAGIVYEF